MAKDIESVRRNRRIEAISRTVLQLGAALFGAAIVKWYHDRDITIEVLGWLIGAMPTIWVGLKVLDLIEPEDD